jgi:hypothetical protein
VGTHPTGNQTNILVSRTVAQEHMLSFPVRKVFWMDLRPEHHEFVKVQWLDDGADSDVLPVHSVALVSKASPAAAASEDSSCPGASSSTAACSAMDTDPSSTPPARRHEPSTLDGTSIRPLPEDATGPRCFLPRTSVKLLSLAFG